MQRTRFTITENTDPFALFQGWYREAQDAEPFDPDAATVATVDEDGMPNARIVLVRRVTPEGFVFFTNTQSQKGRELAAHPKAALCYHWKSQARQVRVQGYVTAVTAEEADAYFNSRHPRSRRGAIASQQSQPLDSIETLEAKVAELEQTYADDDAIPRPPHWAGYRIAPTRIEFWQEGENRLHDRFVFFRAAPNEAWSVQRLYP